MSKVRVMLVVSKKGEDPYEIAKKYSYGNVDGQGFYGWPKCYQERLINNGEEGPLSVPFPLIDGTLSYSALKSEINWPSIHNNEVKRAVYASAWELCVEGREPTDRREEEIKNGMPNGEYFSKFASKDEYVEYSVSFFTYSVATSQWYEAMEENGSVKEWVKGFYDKFVEPLSDDDRLTLFEIYIP